MHRRKRRATSALVILIGIVPLVTSWAGSGTAAGSPEEGSARGEKPKIAVFSGPTATIQNSEPLVTSNKARAKYGLPLLTGTDGKPVKYDTLQPQRLARPVTVYIEAFTAHPLERDVEELYAPPDGYLDARTRRFRPRQVRPDDIPVYRVVLKPEDGLYLLPYMARQRSGQPWDGYCTSPDAPMSQCRVPFYPDASRIVEEIDRFGLDGSGENNLLNSKAEFDYYRPAPSGGYRSGLAASERTDVGSGDIPPEVWGEDFFTYTPFSEAPAMATLARLTNEVQSALGSGDYVGGIWLEGSPTTEETTYWLSLLIDTTVPIVGNSSQRSHGILSNDGDRNIVDSVNYLVSGVWQGPDGKDVIGGVMIQEEQIFAARDVQKADDRPGGYVATGGHGGIIGSTGPLKLTYLPTKKHTHRSDVNLTNLPDSVTGVQETSDGAIDEVPVDVKDAGRLLPGAIAKVEIVKHARYLQDDTSNDPSTEVDILAQIEHNLAQFPLAGFVIEGSAPYGSGDESTMAALERAALRGMPVVRVGRGNAEGFTEVRGGNVFVEGHNLTSTKARLLLMASLMKFGSLPVPADPDNPTAEELTAIRDKVAQYQEVFDTH